MATARWAFNNQIALNQPWQPSSRASCPCPSVSPKRGALTAGDALVTRKGGPFEMETIVHNGVEEQFWVQVRVPFFRC